MKSILNWLPISISIIALAIAGWLFFKADRVVYVDSSKLVNGYKGMEIARKEYQKKTSVWQANIDTLVSEIQKEIMKFEKESSKLTAKEKELTKKLRSEEHTSE